MAFLFLESILFGVFTSLDIMLFYLLFEAVLIPMYLIVGVYGSRERRIRASYLLFLYTLVSSIFMFLAILYIYFKTGTTDYLTLKTICLDFDVEKVCWLAPCSVTLNFPPKTGWLAVDPLVKGAPTLSYILYERL